MSKKRTLQKSGVIPVDTASMKLDRRMQTFSESISIMPHTFNTPSLQYKQFAPKYLSKQSCTQQTPPTLKEPLTYNTPSTSTQKRTRKTPPTLKELTYSTPLTSTQQKTPPTLNDTLISSHSFSHENESNSLDQRHNFERHASAQSTALTVSPLPKGKNSSVADLHILMNNVLQNQNAMQMKLDNLENTVNNCFTILKKLAKTKQVTNKDLPPCFPFKTIADLLHFNTINDEKYSNVVSYLAYLGGCNASDAASLYLKTCFDSSEDLVNNVTWLGSKKNQIISLKATRFAEACEDAMSENKRIMKPSLTEFSWAMTKALKCVKEEHRRNKGKRTAAQDLQGQPRKKKRNRDVGNEVIEDEVNGGYEDDAREYNGYEDVDKDDNSRYGNGDGRNDGYDDVGNEDNGVHDDVGDDSNDGYDDVGNKDNGVHDDVGDEDNGVHEDVGNEDNVGHGYGNSKDGLIDRTQGNEESFSEDDNIYYPNKDIYNYLFSHK